jgi:hypothetical protein
MIANRVAAETEIVGIAAEECHLLLGRKDEPHIGVFLVGVEPVFAALIERDNVGRRPVLSRLSWIFACSALRASSLLGHTALDGALNPRGDVFQRHRDVQLKIGALQLFRLCFRVEAVLDVVLSAVETLAVKRDVMIQTSPFD